MLDQSLAGLSETFGRKPGRRHASPLMYVGDLSQNWSMVSAKSAIMALLFAVGGTLLSIFAPTVLPPEFHAPGFYTGIGLIGLAIAIFVINTLAARQSVQRRIPKILAIFVGVSLLVSLMWWHGSRENGFATSEASAITIKPRQYISLLRFQDASLLLDESQENPFLLQLLNTSSEDAVNVQIKFEIVDLDLEDLILNSNIFRIEQPAKKDRAFIYTRFDWRELGHSVPFKTAGEKSIGIIQSGGQRSVEIDMPAQTKTGLELYAIAAAFEKGKKRRANVKAWIPGLAGSLADIQEKESTSVHDRWIEMPDVRIILTWKSSGKNEKEVFFLRSIYLPLGFTNWVKKAGEDGRARYLIAGEGLLSYESPNDPESPRYSYNWWKQQK
jgi:hypothetical protein